MLYNVVDESSSDDGGFLAPRPLRYFPRGRRRFNLVLPGSFVPSSSLIRPETLVVPRPFASSPIPARSRSVISGIQRQFSPSSADLSSVPRFPVLVQVHQPPYLWKTATTGRHFHPRIPSDPTPPPWEAERIRDNLARDLEYLERQVPPFLRHPPSNSQQQLGSGSVPFDKSNLGSSISTRIQQERSSSSGFQSGSKSTTSAFPSGAGSSGVGTGLGSGGTTSSEVLLRPVTLSGREVERLRMMEGLFPGDSFPPAPTIPSRSFIPPRTYENWPRREPTPPIYAMARSPSFDIEDTQITVPLSEASPGTRTLLDMSVDDPYEFDAVIPDTSPEIAYPSQPPPGSTATSMSRFKRTRDKYENMEARVAAMKEEFFEYRRRQKKRMESAC
ncbi:Protein turtle [Orchesella cincta]|uniref:Protein turtle n=1 Tax=Orchesella cincta TaxID=48709 RepID=A0A1D2N3Y7_ORCCI|nr:Protein turtle [Orchesella cincta]